MTLAQGWNLWLETEDEWDATLQSFDDANIYQSWRWGLHRSNFGWSATHFAYSSNRSVSAIAQVLHRKVTPLATVCWIPGGPIGDQNTWGPDFISCIRKQFPTPMIYIHISPMTPCSDEGSTRLQSLGWRKPTSMLNSDKTLVYEIDPDSSKRREKLSGNWSRNLSRGEQRELTVSEWTQPTSSEIAELTNEMSEFKHLSNERHQLERTTESLLNNFESDVLMTKCVNSDGEILALRGAIKLGHKAFDMFAAATPAGRKEYASNLCFWKLIELCQRDGITFYDLSGVDPQNNAGVYNFKKGIGATDFTYLGEWSYSRPRIVGTIVSRMIARRMRAA
ncbi:MAG: peptidoglycan bridge formation glycyltransferase FemA/FemB family protein [Ilumatobacteraceae bacterium]